MAKTTKAGRKGRRVAPAARRRGARATKAPTLGDVVAAAFEVVGGDAAKARALLESREMARALGRRIVFE